MNDAITEIEDILRKKFGTTDQDTFRGEAKKFVDELRMSGDENIDREKASHLMAEILSAWLDHRYTYDDVFPISRELVLAVYNNKKNSAN